MHNSLEDRNTSLEQHLFEIVSIVLFILMGISCIEGMIVGSSTITITFNGFLSVLGLNLFYLSRYKGLFIRLRYILVIVLNLFFTFYWYWMGGVYGPTAVAGIAVGIVSILLATPRYRTPIFVGFCILLVFLAFSQKYTEWVRVSVNVMETIHLDYAMFAVACLLILNFLKSRFDEERFIVHQKNDRLVHLNKELNTALKDKERVIEGLKRTQDQLIESEKMASIGKLTAGIAHELNNPLNYIGGAVSPVKRDLEEIKEMLPLDKKSDSQMLFEEIDMLLRNVGEGTFKAKTIIEKLGGLLPDKLKRNRFNEKSFLLNNVLESVISEFQLVQSAIQFSLEVPDETYVLADPGDLHMVFSNIFQNSVQAISADQKGAINVLVTNSKGLCKIIVSDNGLGIPKDEVKNVTEPFYTTMPPGGGNGLGMFLVYNLIKVHHGTLEITSKVGKGTDVRIELPTVLVT